MNKEEEDKRATQDAKDAAYEDYLDTYRMPYSHEVPGSYRDAARELWWEQYNIEYDRLLQAEQGAK